jgi:cytochrome c
MAVRPKAMLAVVVAGIALGHLPERSAVQAQTPRSIWNGVYTESQARRGEQLYATWCSNCHGADLAGRPREPRFAGDRDRIPELVGPTFNSWYDRLSLADLVERIRISMPQDKPGVLTRAHAMDVVAYLLFIGGFPLGPAELSEKPPEDVSRIRFLAHRP